ncbi:BED-type domain-containing protein [Nephila pilipes]|uniref:BED-type domain-containing protein n=1 Tax=Nephila pilipes TaxID=299642 RepID=A0A8X6QS04_NEPPI|nr:BED-type domain-containing protein [Nephila pilipes]
MKHNYGRSLPAKSFNIFDIVTNKNNIPEIGNADPESKSSTSVVNLEEEKKYVDISEYTVEIRKKIGDFTGQYDKDYLKLLALKCRQDICGKKETLEEIVSKLVCVDGFTVNAITKSNFIRKSLHDKGYSFPPNPSDVMKLVYKQYNVIKARVTNEISSKLNAGLRCSLTLDEFTSLKNRRYLNINVHFNEGEIFNLGMLRIRGSFSAENCVKAVETKLKEFGIITEKHIVACVTDGASMMVKFGKIMSCENHLCYAHAIHLAVCDVLYNKQIDLGENIVEIEDKSHEEENNDESEELIEDLDKALDLEFESGVGTDASFHITYAEKNSITNINESIKKIRNVVKLFRKSPLKNDILQKYVTEEFGCEKMKALGLKPLPNGQLKFVSKYLSDLKIKLQLAAGQAGIAFATN